MGGNWNLFGFHLHKVLCAVLMLHLLADECLSLNLEGQALLEFRLKVEVDPYGAFENWDPRHINPCNWLGVHCAGGKVEMLDLKELSLEGILAPELGKLRHLKALVLYKNHFSGIIPKEIGGLTMLELLDLRCNNFSGTIPTEIGEMLSLKRLLLCNNKFLDGTPSWIEKSNMLSDLKYGWNLSCDKATEISCLNRKVRNCFWQSGLQQLKKANSLLVLLKGEFLHFSKMFPSLKFRREFSDTHRKEHGDNLMAGVTEPYFEKNVYDLNTARRRLLQVTSNLPAAPISSVPTQEVAVPSTGSGSFPAVPTSNNGDDKDKQSAETTPMGSPAHSSNSVGTELSEHSQSNRLGKWVYMVMLPAVALLLIVASTLLMCRSHGAVAIGPWKTGLSGQLQKAFITGVPKLNRPELEAACEDFSNIVNTFPDFTVFKGTLSSGVEIAVVSSAVPSAKDWSKRSEMCFRKKIDTISRVKHKNYINLLGYCEEDEPFMRMMVFEYTPNGSLFEHLHVKEFDHIDWSARMRIIMGTAYCLQYMHHELNPPVPHPSLESCCVLLTDDYAAKIADLSVWKEVITKGKISGDEDTDSSQLASSGLDSDVYNFGILLLEIISGKVPYSDEKGSILSWAAPHLKDKSTISSLTDPMLKSIKDNELEIICEVIQECIHQDPKKRPTMREVTTRLQEVIAIPPEAAIPRLSPLWWAELEILSVEAS